MSGHRPKVEVVCFTGNSGLTDYSVSLCRELVRHMDVRLVTADSLSPQFHNMGFEVSTVFRRTRHLGIDYIRMLHGIVRRRPQYVLLQSWIKLPAIDSFLAPILTRSGAKVAITIHDLMPHHPKPWSRLELRGFYRSANGLIVHSERTEKGARDLGISKPILTVPHGLYDIFDLDGLSRTAARTIVSIADPTDFVVLFFGSLDRRKGLFEFVEAAKRLEHDKTVRFVVAGKSDLSARDLAHFEAEARSAGVIVHNRRIPFEAVQNYFAATDVVALPYLEGTTSGVLKLALAFGKPVIATRVGDLEEAVSPDIGVLIGRDDIPAALANSIPQLRSQYQVYQSAVRQHRERYGWRNIADKYANFLASL